MFENAEIGHEVSKGVYRKRVPRLRADLLDAQYSLKENGGFPVTVLLAGVDGAGKGEMVNRLSEWMDPRHIHAFAFDAPTDEERQRPRMWRYWRALPPKGTIGVLLGSWYTDPIVDRVYKRISRARLDEAVEEINRFERMLADEGGLILKFWFHLSQKQQKQRLNEIDRDPDRTWRVTRAHWREFKRYDRYRETSERVLRLTSSALAPWIVVEGADRQYRELTVGRMLLEAIRKRLRSEPERRRKVALAAPITRPIDRADALARLDLTRKLPDDRYERQLEKWQGRLNRLSRHKRFGRIAVTVAFEGMDAAGKGGAIRRITAALDARQYNVIPIAAPTDEERAHPYLWRFWRHLPRRGRFTIYDRSWYGRVLVERVEGFAPEADWMRAYGEINDFEEQLVRADGVLCKFWLQTSAAEQLRRFRERQATRFKRFKITPEDWRNREKWPLYRRAAADMIERTSTAAAPWTLVEAEDKNWARIKVLKTLARAIEAKLDAL
jgi:polyphosphate:AMP phosphotransferase